MPGNRKPSHRRGVAPLDNHGWINDNHDVSSSSSFGGTSSSVPNLSRPVHGIEFQPSEICPQNYVIFDESENRSRIMFHPAAAQNLSYPLLGFSETLNRTAEENCGNNYEGANNSPPVIEDSEYIDLLLSLDEEEGRSDEEVSTAGTENYDGCSSPDSCCNYTSKSQKLAYPSSIRRSSIGGSSSHNDNKRKEARKMMKSLRGMVPGGDQMNTAGVFDAAVRYLNGLEDNVQKLALNNHKHRP